MYVKEEKTVGFNNITTSVQKSLKNSSWSYQFSPSCAAVCAKWFKTDTVQQFDADTHNIEPRWLDHLVPSVF